MKKLVVGILAVVLAAGVIAGAVLAADAPIAPPARSAAPAWSNLTDQQKKDLTEIELQMLAVREKMIDKYLEYKWITPQQAQFMKDRIALQKKYAGQFGFGLGRRNGRRGPQMMNGMGQGMMNGFGPGRTGAFGPGMMGWFGQGMMDDQGPVANQ